ncbi:hypothetical protein GGX14DRAFT_461257 [Mycena pura]|uniref:Transmembrane protein n=1 Tax=Mycena pura TaxID=153505 RepID=A0AAD6VAA1_9AGAR|nr:hypothetical protein GGX14DRAFT_461257 [Mycena pura]
MTTSLPAARQPVMDPYRYREAPPEEKDNSKHDHEWPPNPRAHAHHHGRSLRRLLIPALLAGVALSALISLLCLFSVAAGWDVVSDAVPGALVEGLFHVKRAVDGDTNDGTESAFTRHKLYLIVIFVGLVVVLILGIMLSAWCCRGSFDNPLCCPCYLCACCGGLACLECIGCSLCAEAVNQM